MSTTIDNYGVTINDVLAQLPIDSSGISATTEPLSTTDILSFIQSGAAQISTAIINASTDATDAVTRAQCAQATSYFAVAQCLATLGLLGTQAYKDASERFDKFQASMRGNNISEASATKVFSNNSGRSATFRGRNFRGF